MTENKAVVAVHAAICEDSLSECLEWDGRCVQAVEAAAPYMVDRQEIRAHSIDSPK